MAETIEKVISRDESYSVTFEEQFVWVSYFEGQRQRRAITIKTLTIVTETSPYEQPETESIDRFDPAVEVTPASSTNYTITNTSWRRDQDAYYTKVETEITVQTIPGDWVEMA